MGAAEQGASLWSDIPLTRFVDGELWTSNLSLDHVGRHMALYGFMGEGIVRTLTRNSAGTSDREITVVFPDSWDVDVSFANVKLVLQIQVSVSIIGGADGTVFLVGGSNVKTLISTDRFMTKDYFDPLPTGPTTETIRLDVQSVGTSVSVLRTSVGSGTGGPCCGWAFLPLEADT